MGVSNPTYPGTPSRSPDPCLTRARKRGWRSWNGRIAPGAGTAPTSTSETGTRSRRPKPIVKPQAVQRLHANRPGRAGRAARGVRAQTDPEPRPGRPAQPGLSACRRAEAARPGRRAQPGPGARHRREADPGAAATQCRGRHGRAHHRPRPGGGVRQRPGGGADDASRARGREAPWTKRFVNQSRISYRPWRRATRGPPTRRLR